MDGSLVQSIIIAVVSFGLGFAAGWLITGASPAKK